MTDTTETEAPSFRIDLANLCLWRKRADGGETRVNLTPKTFDVLRYLVENAGRLVTHDELLGALWRDVHVQPEVLKSHILAIRGALGDKSANPRFIETQRGRGYRFIGPIGGFPTVAAVSQTAAEPSILAGRAEPLRELQALLVRAASGEPQAVFMSGEPGVGKTTLVQELLAHAKNHTAFVVAQGNCIEGFAGIEPYYPILEALGGLCRGPAGAAVARTILSLAPAWASQMPQIATEQRTAVPLSIDGARSRMLREGVSLLEALATEHRLLLVLEDIHWADYATIDFLSALCRRRSSTKLMLIATYRTEELGSARHPLKQMTHELAVRKYCYEIELGPLSEPAIAEILAGGADGILPTMEFTQFVKQRSGGNPLFAELILEFLLERGIAERVGRGWRLRAHIDQTAFETPPTLGRLLESKLAGLSGEARRALEAGSVAGLRFDATTAARAARMDEQSFEAICEELSRDSCTIRQDELLVLPNGELGQAYAFKHAVFRQVVYDRIGQSRRTSLHRVIGERLEEIYPPDQRSELAVQLAEHFSLARDWPRALHYLRAALRIATNRFARRDALAILDRAFELAANLPDSARIVAEIEFLERRGALQAVIHDPNARDTYARLVARAEQRGDIDAQCRALIGLAYTASWHDLPYSLKVVDQVFALSDRQPDPIQQDVTRLAAYVRRLWASGWNSADAVKCEQILARLKTSGDALTIARAQLNFSMLCLISTRYREARDLVESSYRLLGESPQSDVDAEVARAAWMHHIGVPWCLFSLGEFGAALADLDAGLADLERGGDPYAARYLHLYRGALLFYALDFEAVLGACAPVANSEADATTRILPVGRRIALVFCGLAEAGLGNGSAALAYLQTAEREMAKQPVHLDWYWCLALEWGMINILIANREYAAALARAEHLCTLAAQTNERTWQALAWEGRARAALSCGEAAAATEHVAKALVACQGVDVPLAEWRVHATGARAYKAIGDAGRARTQARLGAAVRKRLAESLPLGHPVRQKFERRSGTPSET